MPIIAESRRAPKSPTSATISALFADIRLQNRPGSGAIVRNCAAIPVLAAQFGIIAPLRHARADFRRLDRFAHPNGRNAARTRAVVDHRVCAEPLSPLRTIRRQLDVPVTNERLGRERSTNATRCDGDSSRCTRRCPGNVHLNDQEGVHSKQPRANPICTGASPRRAPPRQPACHL